MEQYIPKSALVAEIERRIASLESFGSEAILHDNYPVQYATLVTLKSLKFSIDTLEVKEVDLEKEEYQISQSFEGEGLFDGSKVVLKAQKGEEV